METLVQEYYHLINSGFMLDNNSLADTCRITHDFGNFPYSDVSRTDEIQSSSAGSGDTSNNSISDETDNSLTMIKFIGDTLMEEEDLENMPCMYHQCMALQATEKSFQDALLPKNPTDQWNGGDYINQSTGLEFASLEFPQFIADSSIINQEFGFSIETGVEGAYPIQESTTCGKHGREYIDDAEDRSSKLLATSEVDYPESLEMNVLLCSNFDSLPDEGLAGSSSPKTSPKAKKRRSKGRGIVLQAGVDLRGLLMQCSQAVASFDNRTADELLKRIREHSKPTGDATERAAHFFANALEARMSGTGTVLYASSGLKKASASEILKAYQVYVTASPFQRMSNIYSNKSIMKVTGKASTLHIIDFGILYGFQWPCLIKSLSEMPGGPPKLRITGIDCPQPGFRPAERVEATGHRLAKFCNKFNVPFEYIAVAQKWETIQLKDLMIEQDEILAVNCLYRLENVPDETVVSSSPRDIVLSLIKKINPDIFVQGVTNGAFNSPFFATRFREALFHFSSLFDMFETTLPQEDQQRMLFERELIGRNVMNVIACEDTERVERPETYKQWQSRNLRAGFTQLPLDREILSELRVKVKKQYHKDFLVDEDGNWMLQGWKGKVLYSLSCWKPTKRRTH